MTLIYKHAACCYGQEVGAWNLGMVKLIVVDFDIEPICVFKTNTTRKLRNTLEHKVSRYLKIKLPQGMLVFLQPFTYCCSYQQL